MVESVEILKKRDLEGAWRLITEDRLINENRYAIEADALTLIATQQPVAGDVRILAAVLEIVTELERIDDYARGIAPSFINCRTIKGLWINQVLTKSTYCDIIYIELLYIN